MSRLIGNAQPRFVLEGHDRGNCDEQFHGSQSTSQPPMLLDRMLADEGESYGWATPWWPARSNFMGQWDGVAENAFMTPAAWWGEPWMTTGCNSRLGFVGYTRDANGSILASCTVKCFRTSSDELVSSVTSDANGFYIATTPYLDGHYLVVQKPDAVPPVAGASLNTVTPA